MPAPSKWGSETTIGAANGTARETPDITTLADGRYAVVWRENSVIRAQVLETEGFKVSPELLVASPVTANFDDRFSSATIVGLDNGKFAVGFYEIEGIEFPILNHVKIFNANQSVYSDTIVDNGVNDPNAFDPFIPVFVPSLAALPGGKLAAVYSHWSRDLANFGSVVVNKTTFDASGATVSVSAAIQVNTNTTGTQDAPSAAADSAGNLFVAWTDSVSNFDGVGGGSGVTAQFYPAPANPPSGELPVNAITAGNQDQADAIFAAGNATVVYRDASTSATNGTNIRVRFDTLDVVVNTTLSGNQEDPKIALLANGNVVIVWTDHSSGNADIRARIFNPVTGVSDHNDFVVNTTTAGDQTNAEVTAMPDGRFIVTWQDGTSIRSQTFDTRTGPYTFAGTSADEQRSGTVFDDHMSGGGGNDRLYGFSGNDFLYGGTGNDTLIGSAGDDVHDGGAGVDTLIGSLGNDAYYLNDVGADGRVIDTIIESANAGIDGVRTSVNVNLNEARYANVENGYLTGTAVTNLGGSAVNNVLIGNDAANAIYGLGGRDIMRGGLGADKFVYLFNSDTGKTAATRDLIQDFTHFSDKIDLSALDANGAVAGNGTFVFQSVKGAAFTGVAGQLHYLASGANTLIEGDLNGDAVADFQIELTGTIATLTGGVDIIL